jgi:putative N6-adenine-specific DNA methylase
VSGQRTAFASIAPGLEPALAAELQELGFDAKIEAGGASFVTDDAGLARVHLHSRCAGRITVHVGRTAATSLDDLARGIRGMPWRQFVVPGQPVDVSVTTERSRLRYGDTVGKKVQLAIHDALRGPRIVTGRTPWEKVSVLVRIVEDRAILSVDASGERMHRRGWRLATAKAPIRENLAAAILRMLGVEPDDTLVDPMCGSGTFAIEAAQAALGIPPGLKRSYAYEKWPSFDKASAARVKASPGPTRELPIVASDRNAGAIEATKENARRAGVLSAITLVQRDFRELEVDADPGWVVANPPWGERIDGDAAWDAIRAALPRWDGWRIALLAPNPRLVKRAGGRFEPKFTFPSGGTRVTAWVME